MRNERWRTGQNWRGKIKYSSTSPTPKERKKKKREISGERDPKLHLLPLNVTKGSWIKKKKRKRSIIFHPHIVVDEEREEEKVIIILWTETDVTEADDEVH